MSLRSAASLALGVSLLALAGPAFADDELGLGGGPAISEYGRSVEARGAVTPSRAAPPTASSSNQATASGADPNPTSRRGNHGASKLLGHYLNDEELGDPGTVELPTGPRDLSEGSLLDPESESGFAVDPADFEGGDEPAAEGAEAWTWLDTAQATLDGVGVVDPTGIVDLLNGLTYMGRGKWSDGLITMAGIVPFIGDTAKLGKYGAKGAKALAAGGEAIAKGASKFASRKAAFRAARRDMKIPLSQKPFKVKTGKDAPILRDLDGNVVTKADGQPVRAKEYYFRRQSDGEVFAVQEHSLGHASKSGVGDQAAHFNVRPVDARTGEVLNKTPGGFQPHYTWGG